MGSSRVRSMVSNVYGFKCLWLQMFMASNIYDCKSFGSKVVRSWSPTLSGLGPQCLWRFGGSGFWRLLDFRGCSTLLLENKDDVT